MRVCHSDQSDMIAYTYEMVESGVIAVIGDPADHSQTIIHILKRYHICINQSKFV